MAETSKLSIKTEPKTGAPAAPQRSTLDGLRREIDRVFDSFHLGTWRLPFGRETLEFDLPWRRSDLWTLSPAVDVTEKPAGYEITAELPGIDEKDVEVKLSNRTLTIRGQKKEEKEERERDCYISERRYGSFARSFHVPEGVDATCIEAVFAKGVLTVTLPKTSEAQKSEKKIAVKAS